MAQEKGSFRHCRAPAPAVMTAARACGGSLVGLEAAGRFSDDGAASSIEHPANYQGVRVPDDVALGLAFLARSLDRGRR